MPSIEKSRVDYISYLMRSPSPYGYISRVNDKINPHLSSVNSTCHAIGYVPLLGLFSAVKRISEIAMMILVIPEDFRSTSFVIHSAARAAIEAIGLGIVFFPVDVVATVRDYLNHR